MAQHGQNAEQPQSTTMETTRTQVLEWLHAEHLAAANAEGALQLLAPRPGASAWYHFLLRLGTTLGAVLLAAGVIFFFAYNWDELGRIAKLALVQSSLVVAVLLCWWRGLDSTAGRAALHASTLLTGASLAVFGQVYQTGADPWQLFAAWAALITPWALVARQAAVWLTWVAITNLAIALYLDTRARWLWLPTDPVITAWALFAFNTGVLLAWEWLAARGVSWLQAGWARRLVVLASGVCATFLALMTIAGERYAGVPALLAYVAWLALAYAWFRYRQVDLFALAAGALCIIVVITFALARVLLDGGSWEGGMLLIAIAVIGMSAVAAIWLRRLAAEIDA